MRSDNPVGAENQQERLIKVGWMVGFVDGEGCFSIGFVRQPHRPGRRGYKTGFQVTHEFAVVQGERSLDCLEELQSFFRAGQIIVNRRRDNHREHLHRFVVRKRADLLGEIIPFFRMFPLRSAKRVDFDRFALCVELIDQGHHLTSAGLLDIVEIAQTMNRRKPRPELIRILRGHTPDVRDSG
jgi:LAGLIDADG endonuclease